MAESTLTFDVTGMTCQHCVSSVTSEVSGVAGVTNVAVDLTEGRVDVSGTDLDAPTVIAAIAEAGYEATPA